MARTALFILGAGASAEAGCPCMGDFFLRAQDLNIAGELVEVEQDFRRVFKFRAALQKCSAKADLDLFNLEAVLNATEMAATLGLFNDHEPIKVRKSLVRLIAAVLERTQQYNWSTETVFSQKTPRLMGPEGYVQLVSFMKSLRELELYSEIGVVTFNYDLGLDLSLHAQGLQVDYSLEDGGVERGGVFPVCKLHGSLNWFPSGNRSVEAVDLQMITSQATSHRMEYLTQQVGNAPSRRSPVVLSRVFRDHSLINRDMGDALIVPPSESKGDYRKRIVSVWQKGASLLSRADLVVAIGFSIPPTDQFFKLFYALGSVGDTVLRKFVVIDRSSAIESRYRDLLSGHARSVFEFMPATFVRGVAELSARASRTRSL